MGDPQLGLAERLDEAVLLSVLSDVKDGDFSVRMPLGWTGVVGKEGRLSQRVAFRGSDRAWSESIESVNRLIEDLVRPTSEMRRVIGAVADGDLSMAETGVGITPELQRRIFEAFAQADGTTARQYGGTGLGLSISRELVRPLSGEIALSSTAEHGSTFTVFHPSAAGADIATDAPLAVRQGPAPQVAAPQPSLPAPGQTDAGLAGRKALVIDDVLGEWPAADDPACSRPAAVCP